MTDLHQGFAQAQQALAAGRFEEASRLLEPLAKAYPDQVALHHLAAVALKKRGLFADARAWLERALELHSSIAPLHAEYASLLDDLGEHEAALAAYDRALAAAPELLDARIDRALVLAKLDPERGYAELGEVAEANPGSPRAMLNLALMARSLGHLESAAEAADRALALAPESPKALRLRAQLAIDLGRPAIHLYRKAREVAPDDPDALKGEVAALLAEGQREESIALLGDRVAHDPLWYDGHNMLAQIRWQSGDEQGFTDSYRDALQSNRRDIRLWTDLAIITARALGQQAALPILGEARRNAGDDPMLDMLEANAHAELGDLDAARRRFAGLDRREEASFRLPLIRFLLRDGAFERAAEYGLDLVQRGHGPDAWPYVSIAWRMLEDPRWLWLEGDRGLARSFDLDGLKPELPALADRLRQLHRWRRHPFEQSLRGGTQTDGFLFARAEPEIRSLVGHIREAVAQYIADLPPVDEKHPVLSHPRGEFRFTGSWSVRLTGGGFHVNHIHQEGWISSALYVALPSELGDELAQNGWLVLGEPPAEFGFDLPPIMRVRPEPGRLALFPSIMWHGTRPFGEGERLTVAFDVAPGSR